MAKLVETLCTLLAEMHGTTPEEEYQELRKVKQWFDEQDSDTKLWFTTLWFTLDQVRIMKQMSELMLNIKSMTDAMLAVNTADEPTEEESDGKSSHTYA